MTAAETGNNNEAEEESTSLSDWKKRREERRRQRQQEEQHTKSKNEADDYVPYVSVADRKRKEQEALLEATVMQDDRKSRAKRRKQAYAALQSDDAPKRIAALEEEAAEEQHQEDVPSHDHAKETQEDQDDEKPVQSLLEAAAALQSSRTDVERKELQRKEEEARILKEASKVQTNALQAASDLAKGLVYTEPMPSTWTVPRYILAQGEEVWEKTRKEWHMEVEGFDIPPPLKRFKDMKFPRPLLEALEEKNIKRPTPIQMQGLPVALAGRDMVGIAFTGSGKTITFSLPLVIAALEEELRMPLMPGEGPIGIILAPSRELARQTFDVVSEFCGYISNTPEYPQLRTQLLIGGESTRDQVDVIRQRGVHAIVATPGRLRDILKKRFMTLDICRYICLDEADRMLDLGFDEEVGEIMNFFPHQRQTLLFSATFPQKFQDFARSTLVKPIVVNVGRAGAGM